MKKVRLLYGCLLFFCTISSNGQTCFNYSNTSAEPIGPDNGAITTSTINVADELAIDDVNVNISITHTWIGDLTLRLRSPQASEIILYNQTCEDLGDFGSPTFDDSATDATVDCNVPFAGLLLPVQPLSLFNTENSLGNWELEIEDNADGDGGQLVDWTLTLCGTTLNLHNTNFEENLVITQEASNLFTINLTNSGAFLIESCALQVFDFAGRSVQKDVMNERDENNQLTYILNTQAYSSGVYFVNIATNNANASTSLVQSAMLRIVVK